MDARIKERLRIALNRLVFHRMGLDLRKRRDENEFASRILSRRHAEALQADIAAIASEFLAADGRFLPDPGRAAVATMVDDFFALYEVRPVTDNTGGGKFADSFWLYFLARVLEPALIVESGTHKGHSSWLLRAASPDATIHCCDVSFANLLFRDPASHYHESDWMEVDLAAADPARSLCYFDDHINQAQRIAEAHARGFRLLAFDDDRTARTLYATGHPPVPTIAMLFDETLRPGDEIRWRRHGVARNYIFREEDTFHARALIERHARTPDIAAVTRYRPQAGLTVVKLRA